MDLKLYSAKAVKVKLTCLLALIAIMATYTSASYPNPPDKSCPAAYNSKRYCSASNKFGPTGKEQQVSVRIGQDLYDANRLQVREYKYYNEFFEGSISLTQIGMAWKQISTQAADQITVWTGTKSTEVVRIMHFWQLPHVWLAPETKLNYDDLRTASNVIDDPNINDFYEVLYTNPMLGSGYSDLTNQATYQWFVGDLVPMKSCAYIVNMNSKGAGATKYYSFQRIMMSIQYDTVTFKKITKIVPDTAWISAGITTTAAIKDLPETSSSIEINYYFGWRAFYWFQRGLLIIKQDTSYTTTADPCQRDTPIFNPSGTPTLVHYAYQFGTTGDTILSHAFVYEGLYMVWNSNKKKIQRLEGTPDGTTNFNLAAGGFTDSFFTMSLITNSGLVDSTDSINQIASMEWYGLFVNVNGKRYFIEIEPHKIMQKNADGTLKLASTTTKQHLYSGTLLYDGTALTDTTKTLGLKVRDDAQTICTGTQFKFAQTYGEMSMHRPVYLICDSDNTTLYRVTTVINKFFSVPAAHPTRLWTSLYDYPLQTLRFHMIMLQPGNTATIAPDSPAAPNLTNKALTGNALTWEMLEAVVVDLRKEDEVLRWNLAICGDTVVNATAFETCDYAKNVDTPINLIDAELSTMNTYNYPAKSADNQRTNLLILGATAALNNALEKWSGEKTIWWDLATKTYYNCNLLCKKVAISLCGDGIPSNGRVPNTTGGYKKDPTNQEVGTDLVPSDAGYELCDDGTTRSGDGCSADCKTIETGYECPRWGIPCQLKCGNGHRQWVTTAGVKVSEKYARNSLMTDTLGQPVLGTDGLPMEEECDFGTWNTNDPTNKLVPCNADCKVTNKNLWDCQWVADLDGGGNTLGFHSACTYLCGNKKVDRIADHPGMTISETCDKGVQQWTGAKYSNGYNFPLATGATNSNAFTGSIASPVLGTLIAGDGSKDVYNYWLDSTGPVGGRPQWFSTPKTNADWLVGCDEFCQIVDRSNPLSLYSTSETFFKCPSEWVSSVACTDRCGDGIFDGYIDFNNAGRNRATQPYPTGVNGYTPQNSVFGFDYATRMPVEGCDTGQFSATDTSALGYNYNGIGDPTGTHGCDSMCQIVPGWQCTHFFYKMLRREANIEEPLFRSECWQTSDPTKGPYRRRLQPEDFDHLGRYLHHTPQRYNNFLLPSNYHEFQEDVLKQSPKQGLNGQVRIIEAPCQISSWGCTVADTVVGVVYGYENTVYTNDDYVYIKTIGKATPANDFTENNQMSANSNAQKGKMRNTFGHYLVMNENLNRITIYAYKDIGGGSLKMTQLWTSTVETSVQYMGAHEFYWWPYNSFLMAKLSDGSSFKFLRFAKNFLTTFPTAEASLPDANKIQDNDYNLFHATGSVTVPPVFHEQFIYLYTSQNSVGTIRAYYYNSAKMEMDLVCQKTGIVESSTLYHNYSLVKVGADGIIFHMPSTAATYMYYCNWNTDVETTPVAFTETTVTFDLSVCSANPTTSTALVTPPIYCGLASLALSGVILKQPREDPETYVSGTIPTIWGWFTNQYFMSFAYSNNGANGAGTAPKLKPTKSILLPKQLHLVGVNYVNAVPQGNFVAENMDVGNLFLAVLSPVQCKATYQVSAITNPSVYFYNLANTDISYDLINCDTNPVYFSQPDGFDDYAGCTADMDTSVTPNVQKVTANGWKKFLGTAYDPWKGWKCIELPVTETGTQAWQNLV